jgi:hypothetical protein
MLSTTRRCPAASLLSCDFSNQERSVAAMLRTPAAAAAERPWLRLTSCEPGTATMGTIASRPARCRKATTRPRPMGTSTRCARPGRPAPPSHSRIQRGADRAAAAPRTPERVRPDTRTPDTGHRDAGRPLDRPDGHPHGGPDEADRTTTGLAGVRTSSPGHGAWGRSASHDGSTVTAPAPRPRRPPPLDSRPAPPGTRPRSPGALLSSDDYGSSVLRKVMRPRRARQGLVRGGERS